MNWRATRIEGMVMLIRLLGEDSTVTGGTYSHTFRDVPTWGNTYMGYAFQTGLSKGASATTFGSTEYISVNQYAPFILRALGYSEASGDFFLRTGSPGDGAVLTASMLPAGVSNKNIVWFSSAPTVATVTNKTVSAVAAGTTTITASATDGSGKTDKASVTVAPKVTSMLETARSVLQDSCYRLIPVALLTVVWIVPKRKIDPILAF